MNRLKDHLPLPAQRADILQACRDLLDAEVSKKKGLSGLAVKAGYGVLKAIKPSAVPDAIDSLLDDFIDALDPFHEEHCINPQGSFGSALPRRRDEVAQALLAVTDRKAERAKHQALKKIYEKLRPAAVRNVAEATEGLGQVMDRFYTDPTS